MFVNAYKNVMSVAVSIDYSFPQADEVKKYLQFAALVAAAAPVADSGAAPAVAAVEEKEEEDAEESNDDGCVQSI
ncbi:hypothetical protein RIF29_08207 [Crotalaria pallida]|uniref:Uncharacterized protein n=1 Tax=Crotalaria pallida TaxID=3830 RepID=A0AAN9PB97_CROPI